MKKVLVIVMLIIAMGLVGCPRRYYDRDRHDQDRGHDTNTVTVITMTANTVDREGLQMKRIKMKKSV